MGLFSFLSNLRAKVISGQSPRTVIDFLLSSSSTSAGVDVTPEGSISSTAVLAAIRRISQGVAMLPLPVYSRNGDNKERAPNHPLYEVLHNAPNPEITSFEFREMMQASLLVRGNAYAEIVRNSFGQVTELWPMRSDKVRVERINGELVYFVEVNGKEFALPGANVFHLKGFSLYGLVGLCLLDTCKDSIGLSLAQEKFYANFFQNDATPGGFLTHPGSLSADAQKNLVASVESRHQGLGKKHRVMVLEEGMKFEHAGLSPEDALLITGRTFQIQEVARLFDIPPHLIGELSHATFTNIEHQSLEYVKFTLGPWLVRWEQKIAQQLLQPLDRKQYFAEFLVEGLLRGDAKARGEFYATLFNIGALSPNEIRSLENMNPVPDGDGHYVQLNMVEVGKEPMPTANPKPQDIPDNNTDDQEQKASQELQERRAVGMSERVRLREAYKPILRKTAERVVHADVREVRKLIDRHLRGRADRNMFLEELALHYQEFLAYMREQFGPVFDSIATAIGPIAATEVGGKNPELPDLNQFKASYMDRFVARFAEASQGQIAALDTVEEIEQRLEEWTETRADKVADRQAVQFEEAIAKSVFAYMGITKLVWRANSGACPLCNELDGQVVGIDKWFVPSGGTVEGGDKALTSYGNVGHAPLHRGCACSVGPA